MSGWLGLTEKYTDEGHEISVGLSSKVYNDPRAHKLFGKQKGDKKRVQGR